MPTTTKPEEYYNTDYEKHGQIHKIGINFNVHNWKEATGEILKKTNQWDFRFAVCKRNAGEINPTPPVPVKEAKIKDVKKLLLLHYGEGWKNLPDLQFYIDIIASNCESENNISEDENEGGPVEDVEDFV
ncbi:hypothetical protein PR048_031965 [Dryococelus australis]|uniref:Uncharacterized protein n=1 Tax=Dryococelus australis TaxID=614101 RepID=A0ABQ9GAT6_9NEOP|nr:hypothetical protein PR048_031965 [Dryococelus australis]